jgi:hypothetical protein
MPERRGFSLGVEWLVNREISTDADVDDVSGTPGSS